MKLQSCPFCGGGYLTVNRLRNANMWNVMCLSCGCQGPTEETEREAVDRWQRRQPPRDAVRVHPVSRYG